MNGDSLSKLICELELCAESLYQEKTQAGYTRLMGILPQLETVIMSLQGEEQLVLTRKLQGVLAVMENGDNTLLADMLQYELTEQLQKYV